MENVILVIHLILALCLIGIVLLQRSEGGGLGMGGGDGAISARGAATAMGKLTWIFAIAFICTSLTLTVFARQNAASSSVVDGLSAEELAPSSPDVPAIPDGESLLPPSAENDPLALPRAE